MISCGQLDYGIWNDTDLDDERVNYSVSLIIMEQSEHCSAMLWMFSLNSRLLKQHQKYVIWTEFARISGVQECDNDECLNLS